MRTHDWQTIQRYHDDGHGFVACRERFGFSHTAWRKAILRGELSIRPRLGEKRRTSSTDRRRVYDWAEIQAFYDEGHSFRDCKARFGFSAGSWTKAVQRGELKARARSLPIPVLLVTAKSRAAVRRRLLRDGLLENRCSLCHLDQWQGKPLVMQIDHVNGVGHDHRLENLRMLCPNCHSQTETFAGRNVRRRGRKTSPSAPERLQEPPPQV